MSGPEAATSGAFHRLVIEEVRPECDDGAVIRFRVPEDWAERFRFKAGQHLTVRRSFNDEELRRSYSICAPEREGRLEIAIRRLPGGQFSNWALDQLRAGETLDVLTPTGGFVLPEIDDRPRHFNFIAAGSGITPILSQLSTLMEADPRATATLLYLNQRTDRAMFLEELLALKNRHVSRLALWFHSSREHSDGALFEGRLTASRLEQLIADDVLPISAEAWLLCGPQPLVKMIADGLHRSGVSDGEVRSELFGVSETPPPILVHDGARATVRFHGRGSTILVPAGTTILDAARCVRPDLPFACKTGVCSTCRARVVAGEVEMVANYALTAAEVERGFVLTCQSYPRTDVVELDFDA